MKKILTLVLVSTLIMVSFLVAAEETGTAKAWEQALALVEQKLGYSKQQLEKNQIVFGNGVWAFSLTIKDHPQDEDGLLVGQMDTAGNLLSLQGPEKVSLDRQLEVDLKNSFNRDDGYLLLVAVHEKWSPILQALSEEQVSKIFPKYVALINLNLALPHENAISYEDAYQAALHFLAQQPGWSADQAQMFRLAMSAYYAPVDIGRFVYFFYFEQHVGLEAAYRSEKAMNKYQAELIKAFGGVAPRQLSIMVDALDGSLVKPPILDYAPVQHHYLDFINRTEEIIQAEKEISP